MSGQDLSGMSSVNSSKQRSSGRRAWRLKWPKHIVVFDPREQGGELERGKLTFCLLDRSGEC